MNTPAQVKIDLFVEGQYDAAFLRVLLPRVSLGSADVTIHSVGGKAALRRILNSRAPFNGTRVVALVDADEPNVPDAREHARRELGYPNAAVFCAVPTIEAWLFADLEALLGTVRSEWARELVARLPLPEEIPFPKQLATRIFGDIQQSLSVVEQMDIAAACARSPSLNVFLKGLGEVAGADLVPAGDVHARSLPRDVFSNLLAEVSPAGSVVYRTVDGTSFTAEQMIRHVREGTDVGRQYSSDLLRISRDFLARQAQREARS